MAAFALQGCSGPLSNRGCVYSLKKDINNPGFWRSFVLVNGQGIPRTNWTVKPQGLFVNSSHFMFADEANHLVVVGQLNTNKEGLGTQGLSSLGRAWEFTSGLLSNATFSDPRSIAVGPNGHIYVAGGSTQLVCSTRCCSTASPHSCHCKVHWSASVAFLQTCLPGALDCMTLHSSRIHGMCVLTSASLLCAMQTAKRMLCTVLPATMWTCMQVFPSKTAPIKVTHKQARTILHMQCIVYQP